MSVSTYYETRGAKAVEGGRALFEVTLDQPSTETITVRYQTALLSGPDAASASDFISINTQVIFLPGVVSSIAQPVVINTDNLVEPDERFLIVISVESGNAVIADGRAVAVIAAQCVDPADDQQRPPTLTIEDAVVDEGDPGSNPTMSFEFLVNPPFCPYSTLTDSTDPAVQVSVNVQNVTTDDSDWQTSRSMVTFPRSIAFGYFDVTVLGDSIPEGDEQFRISASWNQLYLFDKSDP